MTDSMSSAARHRCLAAGSVGLSLLTATCARAQGGAASGAPAVKPKLEFIEGQAISPLSHAAHDLTPWGMYLAADSIVKSVLLVLLLASLITWTICVAKLLELRGERRRLQESLALVLRAEDIKAVGDLPDPMVAEMLVQAEDEMAVSGRLPPDGVKERVASRLDGLEARSRRRLGSGMGVLAIIGSTAPFVGLFGTVWGIMSSFIGIAESHTTNLAVVAPGIAEALLTTAFGLVAAVPAVIVYNLFSRALTGHGGEVGEASAAVWRLAAREIDHERGHDRQRRA